MSKFNILAVPAAALAATLMAGSMAQATPNTVALTNVAATAQSAVTISMGIELKRELEILGEPEVQSKIDQLQAEVEQAINSRYPGATAELEVSKLLPNRPTMQQLRDRPGLDPIRSVSIGGATIKGTIVTAQGERRPVDFSYYSPSLRDVWGFGVWSDADRAFTRFSNNIERGRY